MGYDTRGSKGFGGLRRLLIGTAMLLPLAALPPLPAFAQSAPAASAGSVEIDPARLAGLSQFVDGIMAQQIATREIAGAVVTVVSKGKILFSNGYGFSDIDKKIPVDGEKTLFRPGSVSKLLTWTALMQQVEQGKIKLDDEVNKYLDFKLPYASEHPILVRHLMEHSAGFEDQYKDMFIDSYDKVIPLADFLKTHIPNRVREPGVESSYSNYSTALAGYIVQRVSGEAFPDYIERHVTGPLGMTNTTFREPLKGMMAQNMSVGYALKNGRFVAQPFHIITNIMPAGSLSATGPDMARFIMAHLHDGRLGDAQILKPETAREMREDLLGNAPDLPGMAHGLMVLREQGPRLVGHGGNTSDFHAFLLMAPEADFGFFVTTTGGPASYDGRTELVNALIGRVFPQNPAPRWTGAVTKPDLGSYRTNRRNYSETPKPENDIKVTAEGERAVVTDIGGKKTYWEQIAPDMYEQVTGVRAGGPYDRLEFYGPENDRKMSFGSQPHVLYRLVWP